MEARSAYFRRAVVPSSISLLAGFAWGYARLVVPLAAYFAISFGIIGFALVYGLVMMKQLISMEKKNREKAEERDRLVNARVTSISQQLERNRTLGGWAG